MSTQSTDNRSRRSADDRREPESDAIVQKSHEVTSNIKQAALDRVDSVRQGALALRDDTSDRVRKFGAAMHKVGEHFRIEDQQYVAEQMTGVSKRIGMVADYVDSAQIGSVLRDARSLARRQPALFWGGAFLLGLGAGRFVKGTSLIAGGGADALSRPSRRSTQRSLTTDADDVPDSTPSDKGQDQKRRGRRASSADAPAGRNRDF